MAFTIGTDPEFALIHKNQFKSAIRYLKNKKRAAKQQGNSFYYDNVLAEVGLKPATTKQDFLLNIQNALVSLTRIACPAEIIVQASMKYSTTELQDKQAKIAGCKPELSAYTLQEVMPPVDYIVKDNNNYMKHVTSFRTAGGHIHLGGKAGHILQNPMAAPYVVKMLDLFLAIPELYFNKDKTAKDRRRVYGLAGTHRTPNYGVEYRALSNYWLSSPVYASLVYDLCDFVLQFIAEESHLKFWNIDETLLDGDNPALAHECIGYNVDLLREAIDTVNTKLAQPFYTFIMNYLPENIIHDLEVAIKYNPKDIKEEWSIFSEV